MEMKLYRQYWSLINVEISQLHNRFEKLKILQAGLIKKKVQPEQVATWNYMENGEVRTTGIFLVIIMYMYDCKS